MIHAGLCPMSFYCLHLQAYSFRPIVSSPAHRLQAFRVLTLPAKSALMIYNQRVKLG